MGHAVVPEVARQVIAERKAAGLSPRPAPVERRRCHPTAFILPPWREIYRTDDERDQTFDEAVMVYRALRDWYIRCGYNLVEVPTGTVANRRDFVLGRLKERAKEADG